MSPEAWIEEARLRLDDARLLHSEDRPSRAVSAAYFACHAAGRAALQSENIQTRTHSGLRNRIGYHFVQTERCSADVTRWLAELEQLRQEADYDLRVFSLQKSEDVITQADRCVGALSAAID